MKETPYYKNRPKKVCIPPLDPTKAKPERGTKAIAKPKKTKLTKLKKIKLKTTKTEPTKIKPEIVKEVINRICKSCGDRATKQLTAKFAYCKECDNEIFQNKISTTRAFIKG